MDAAPYEEEDQVIYGASGDRVCGGNEPSFGYKFFSVFVSMLIVMAFLVGVVYVWYTTVGVAKINAYAMDILDRQRSMQVENANVRVMVNKVAQAERLIEERKLHNKRVMDEFNAKKKDAKLASIYETITQ